MAINFPSSPSENDTYTVNDKTYRYNGYAWQFVPPSLNIPTRVVSATKPDNPAVGTVWTNSSTGKNFVYLNDGTSTQWVEEVTFTFDAGLTTANVSEFQNLYFTNARAIGALSEGDGIIIDSNGMITANVISASPTTVSDQENLSTGYLSIPIGTTAERPNNAPNGSIRYNTTTNSIEGFVLSNWITVASSPLDVMYIVVGGGGGGGETIAGGGGGGQVYTGNTSMSSGSSFSVLVGAGGTRGGDGNNGSYPSGFSGNPSNIVGTFTVTAAGGGAGGGYNTNGNGPGGGNGGGQGAGGGAGVAAGSGLFSGGTTSSNQNSGAGGGGAAQAGSNGVSGTPGKGGDGWFDPIQGKYFGGGGGGGARNPSGGTGGAGGLGGGGAGGTGSGNGTDGTANTGGGGGGGGYQNSGPIEGYGGFGGSGVVIFRYSGGQRATGGTITTSNGYTIHTFTGAGSFEVT